MLSPKKFQELYVSMYEARDDDAKEMRRLAAQERRAGKSDRLDSKTAEKYAGSESNSAEREDKKSKGKHIHGMADSVELDGDLVDEGKVELKQRNKNEMQRKAGNLGREVVSTPNTKKNAAKRGAAMDRMGKLVSAIGRDDEEKRFKTINREEVEIEEKKGLWDNIHAKRKRGESPAKPGEKGYPKTLNIEENELEEGLKQARKNVGASTCWKGKKVGNPSTKMKGGKEVPNCVPEELELDERALDTAEKGEKERLVKGMKKSAADFKKRYGKDAMSVMYATATKKAKKHMDTSKSDRRYSVEEVTMEEETDLENRKKVRKPSELAKKAKLDHLITKMKEKKEKGEN